MLDGGVVGVLYASKDFYEYRGEKPIGKHELTWVACQDKRLLIDRLNESLEAEAVEQRKKQFKR